MHSLTTSNYGSLFKTDMQVQLLFGLTGGKLGPLTVLRLDASVKMVIILLSGVIIPLDGESCAWYVSPLFGPEVYVEDQFSSAIVVIPSPVTV